MTDQELKDKRMYNITKYLNNCYLNKVEPSIEIMKDVDFSEVSVKEIQFFEKKFGHLRSTVNESLAINCISNLPYEAYQQFVSNSWLYFEKDYDGSLFKTGIIYKNIALVEKLHDIGLDSALNDKQMVHGYQRRCLDSILNFNFLEKREGFPISDKDFGQRYLTLIKKATSELEYFHQTAFIGEKRQPLNYSSNPDWLKMATTITRSSYPSGFTKNQIMATLVSQTELLPLFEDAIILLMKNNRQNLKGILGFGEIYPENEYENPKNNEDTTNILSVAFANNNFEAAKMIVESLNLSPQVCLAAYESNIKEKVDNLIHEDYENEKIQPFALILKDYFNSSYRKFKAEFFPELDTGYLSLFVLGKDKILKQQILDNKDMIFDTPISTFQCDLDSQSRIEKKITSASISPLIIRDEDDEDDADDSYYTKYNTDFNLNDSLFTAKIIEKFNEFLTTEGKKYFYPKDRQTLKNMCLNDFVIDYLLKSEKELLKSIDITSIPEIHWNRFNQPSVLLHLMDTMKIKQGHKNEPIIDSDFKLLLETVRLEVDLGENNVNNTKSNKLKI